MPDEISIKVNGQPRQIVAGSTLATLLDDLDLISKHVAVEVNLELVPRSRHAEYTLQAGDQLEIVSLVGGG